MRRVVASAAAVALALVASCAREHGPVRIGTTWPDSPGGYQGQYEKWTREASARNDVDLIVEVSATLKSAEWRAAWVEAQTSKLSLSADERARLIAEQQKAAAETWEVELIVGTANSLWQDFGAGRSMWRVALVGDDGREALPLSIREDGRPRAELEIWYPALRGQRRAYVVRFPALGSDGAPLVADGADKLTMEVAGAPGRVDLVWRGK
jgi:hypothetical protein